MLLRHFKNTRRVSTFSYFCVFCIFLCFCWAPTYTTSKYSVFVLIFCFDIISFTLLNLVWTFSKEIVDVVLFKIVRIKSIAIQTKEIILSNHQISLLNFQEWKIVETFILKILVHRKRFRQRFSGYGLSWQRLLPCSTSLRVNSYTRNMCIHCKLDRATLCEM